VTTESETVSVEPEVSPVKQALGRMYQARTLIALLILVGALALYLRLSPSVPHS